MYECRILIEGEEPVVLHHNSREILLRAAIYTANRRLPEGGHGMFTVSDIDGNVQARYEKDWQGVGRPCWRLAESVE